MSPATSPADGDATRVWTAMQAFVDAHDRRKELQEALGLGRGLAAVKLLLFLLPAPATLRDIAAAGGMDAPYATVIVNKIEGLGLVERTAHPDDHRRKLVQLTRKGREAAQLAARLFAEPPESLESLPTSDLSYLEHVLARLTSTPRA